MRNRLKTLNPDQSIEAKVIRRKLSLLDFLLPERRDLEF